ncbi:MAG: PHB depolymerase family esterase [Candidatus Aminicenantales bacterium]
MRTGWIVLGLMAALALAACRPSEQGEPAVLDTPFPVTDALGNARQYRLFLPKRTGKPYPLIAYFHGVISPGFKKIPSLKRYTGSPIEETGLIDFCREQGIALLVPEALYVYTFLDCPSTGWVIDKELDGVEKMVDAVIANCRVDRKQVYLAGISAGAVFSHFLANHRPDFYASILSHSQAYVSPEGRVLTPVLPGPRFGVVFGYNEGDYPELIRFCVESEKTYRESGYRTALLPDLPPRGHAWSSRSNARFWKLMRRLGRKD